MYWPMDVCGFLNIQFFHVGEDIAYFAYMAEGESFFLLDSWRCKQCP
jgi:hypothetical protein